MTDWVNVCKVEALAKGERLLVDLEGARIVVFNLDGEFYAIEDTCTHDGGELSSGEIDGDEIVCPRHGARFCIRTGEVTAPPAFEDIASFPVRVVDDLIQVKDDR